MRNYRVESIDPRDDTIININTIKADLFVVDDEHVTVTFYVTKLNDTMTPVAMFPFQYVVSVIPDFIDEEGEPMDYPVGTVKSVSIIDDDGSLKSIPLDRVIIEKEGDSE